LGGLKPQPPGRFLAQWERFDELRRDSRRFNIDSAKRLIANKWTTADRLVIEGGSAGGLSIR
jgi:protease II